MQCRYKQSQYGDTITLVPQNEDEKANLKSLYECINKEALINYILFDSNLSITVDRKSVKK